MSVIDPALVNVFRMEGSISEPHLINAKQIFLKCLLG